MPDEAEKQKIKDSLPNLNFYKAHSITHTHYVLSVHVHFKMVQVTL